MENTEIKFDPGYAPIALPSLGQVGYLYYTFGAIKNIKLKKLTYLNTFKKIEYHLKNNIAFYLGCLLWAVYIKQFDAKITGNQLFGETCEEKEYTSELDFLIDFVENKIPRDFKYFLNKQYMQNKQHIEILKTYREFLVINKGFCNVSETNQIKLPDNLKIPEELEKINNIIQKALQEKNLEMLYEVYSLIF